MVQIIGIQPTQSTAGLVGQALGEGLVKRAGLSEAEKAFSQAQGDPVKLATAFARLMSVSPDLARGAGPMYQAMLQMQRGKELASAQQSKDYLPQAPQAPGAQSDGQLPPSITERTPLEETIKPYIPREYGQIVTEASQRYPKLFSRDPDAAIQQEMQEEQQRIARSKALQATRQSQEDVEGTIKNKLNEQIRNLGIKEGSIAGNLLSKIQDKAIRSVKPVSEGGEGLTEQQAAKIYGKEIEDAARDYNVMKSWGGTYTMGPWNARNVVRQIDSTRENFKERNDLENFADLLVAENGLSNKAGYYYAFPPHDYPNLKKELNKIPDSKIGRAIPERTRRETLEMAPKLAKAMGTDGSPLAIAQALEFKGYDSGAWLDYLNQNRKELDLTERQARELGKSVTTVPNLQDIWLFTVTNKNKY